MRALLPATAVCLVGLCRCSLFVGLDGLDNADGADASSSPFDGAATDATAGAQDVRALPESAADAFLGPPDATGVVDGGTLVDSTGDETDLPVDAETPDGSADAFREASIDGKLDFPDAGDGTLDFPDAGDGSPDALEAGRSCDPAKPFGAPVLLTSLESTAKEGTFRLLQNELTGFFWSSRAGGPGPENLYVTARTDINSPFGGSALLNNVNLANDPQYEPTVSDNGLYLAFRSVRNGGVGGSDLYSASRADTKSDFANVKLIGNVNSTFNDVQPFVAGVPNGTEIYFASNRTGDYDLYHATGSLDSYGTPRAITDVNTAGVRDEQPVVSPNDLAMLFSSARAGGLGANDIWMATRSTNFSNFGVPTNLTSVNTTGMDYPDWLSPDGCRLYLSSDISGMTHIYVATRPM